VYANVEIVQQSGSSNNCYGTLTTGSSVSKTMPSSGLYDVYLAKATPITYAATITPKLITSSTNPYGTANAEGVYSIAVPSGQNLQITGSRITGTLVISMTGGTLNITGPILWEPARPDYPILILKGSSVTVNITGSTTWLSESSVGVDLNGNGTTSDDLQPQYRGVMHVIGSSNNVNVSGNAYIKGLLLIDGTITTTGQSTYVADSSYQTRPPMGYGKGDQLAIVPGSWVWDSPP
jgi:hypothetical protein